MGVIQDVMNTIKDLSQEIVNVRNRYDNTISTGSIAKAARQGICQFPVICESGLSVEEAMMVNKAIEREAVSFISIYTSINKVRDEESIYKFIRSFHSNDHDTSPDSYSRSNLVKSLTTEGRIMNSMEKRKFERNNFNSFQTKNILEFDNEFRGIMKNNMDVRDDVDTYYEDMPEDDLYDINSENIATEEEYTNEYDEAQDPAHNKQVEDGDSLDIDLAAPAEDAYNIGYTQMNPVDAIGECDTEIDDLIEDPEDKIVISKDEKATKIEDLSEGSFKNVKELIRNKLQLNRFVDKKVVAQINTILDNKSHPIHKFLKSIDSDLQSIIKETDKLLGKYPNLKKIYKSSSIKSMNEIIVYNLLLKNYDILGLVLGMFHISENGKPLFTKELTKDLEDAVDFIIDTLKKSLPSFIKDIQRVTDTNLGIIGMVLIVNPSTSKVPFTKDMMIVESTKTILSYDQIKSENPQIANKLLENINDMFSDCKLYNIPDNKGVLVENSNTFFNVYFLYSESGIDILPGPMFNINKPSTFVVNEGRIAFINNELLSEFSHQFNMDDLNSKFKPTNYSVYSPTNKVLNEKYNIFNEAPSVAAMGIRPNSSSNSPTYTDGNVSKGKGSSKPLKLMPSIVDSDVKKANEIQPSLLHIKVYFKADDGTLQDVDFHLGVKSILHIVNKDTMIDHIVRGIRKSDNIFNFIRWTTGEIEFFRDFLLTIDDIKKDVMASRQDVKQLNKLRSMANTGRFRNAFGSNKLIPNATLVLSKDSVDYINRNFKLNLFDMDITKKFMQTYFLMGFIILDSSMEVAYVCNDADKDFKVYTYKALDKANKESDKSAKDFLQILSRM